MSPRRNREDAKGRKRAQRKGNARKRSLYATHKPFVFFFSSLRLCGFLGRRDPIDAAPYEGTEVAAPGAVI